MTEQPPRSPRARLFVALDLPPSVCAAVGAGGRAELTDPALRPAPAGELSGPGSRPSRGRPRFFALAAHSPGTERLQAQVSERLAQARLYEPEKRAFWPHVTIARVRAEGRGSRRPRAVERPPKELPPGLSEAFHGVRLTLYRSELQPLGARYVPLAQVELPGAGRQ